MFTITKKWEQSKCSSVDKQINEMYIEYVYKMEYYPFLKKNEILRHVTNEH